MLLSLGLLLSSGVDEATPPKIQLSLAQNLTNIVNLDTDNLKKWERSPSGHNETTKTSTPSYVHNFAAGNVTRTENGKKVESHKLWRITCNATTSESAFDAECPYPTSYAYDVYDRTVDVTETSFKLKDCGTNRIQCGDPASDTRCFQVTDDNMVSSMISNSIGCSSGDPVDYGIKGHHLGLPSAIDISSRGTYELRYDAVDDHLNRADQLVVELVLLDQEAPVLDSVLDPAPSSTGLVNEIIEFTTLNFPAQESTGPMPSASSTGVYFNQSHDPVYKSHVDIVARDVYQDIEVSSRWSPQHDTQNKSDILWETKITCGTQDTTPICAFTATDNLDYPQTSNNTYVRPAGDSDFSGGNSYSSTQINSIYVNYLLSKKVSNESYFEPVCGYENNNAASVTSTGPNYTRSDTFKTCIVDTLRTDQPTLSGQTTLGNKPELGTYRIQAMVCDYAGEYGLMSSAGRADNCVLSDKYTFQLRDDKNPWIKMKDAQQYHSDSSAFEWYDCGCNNRAWGNETTSSWLRYVAAGRDYVMQQDSTWDFNTATYKGVYVHSGALNSTWGIANNIHITMGNSTGCYNYEHGSTDFDVTGQYDWRDPGARVKDLYEGYASAEPAEYWVVGDISDTTGQLATGTSVVDDDVKNYLTVVTNEDGNGPGGNHPKISYTYTDTNNNQAQQMQREVHVVDRIRPFIWLNCESGTNPKNDCQGTTNCPYTCSDGTDEVITHRAGEKFVDPGAHCEDLCSNTTIEMAWDREFNDKRLGCYTRTYTCKDRYDGSGFYAPGPNTDSTTRKFCVIDETDPIINLVGPATQTIEATRDSEYEDDGATCHDYVDGVLNHAVEVSGDNVNLRIPGTYYIKYDCTDLSGRSANQVIRTVIVEDTGCPTIHVLGIETNFIESGFPWEDAGFQATDDLDGLLPDGEHIDSRRASGPMTFHYKWSDGDTVTSTAYFYNRRSCSDILAASKRAGDAANTGEYFITTYNSNRKVYERIVVWCDMADNGNAYTFFFYDAHNAVELPNPTASCDFFGLVPWDGVKFNATNTDGTGADAYSRFVQKWGTELLMQTSAASKRLLCVTNDTLTSTHNITATVFQEDGSSHEAVYTEEEDSGTIPGHANAHQAASSATNNFKGVHRVKEGETGRNHANEYSARGAEAGRYVINYHARDFGTWNVNGDELKFNTECQSMSRTVIVKDNIFDFDDTKSWNKNYKWQAEVGNNVNGWAMGSIAFAVTGMALLAFRQKRTVIVDV